jgi:hypothetical protein
MAELLAHFDWFEQRRRSLDPRVLHFERKEDLGDVDLLRESTLQGELRDGVHRLRQAGGEGVGLPSEDDNFWWKCVPTGLGLCKDEEHRRQVRSVADVRHGSHQWACGCPGN